MNFVPINNNDSIKDKIAYQYIESVNLQSYIEVLLSQYNELEQVITDILNYRMFETTTINALDIWGLLVGKPRESYDTTIFPYFGLDAADINNPVKHLGMGDLDDSLVGGIFRSIEQSIAQVQRFNNEDYRPLLKGKQASNNFKGGTEALIDAILQVLGEIGPGIVHVEEVFTEPTDPFVRLTFNVQVNLLQRSYFEVLKVLPKPGGIRYEYVYSVT